MYFGIRSEINVKGENTMTELAANILEKIRSNNQYSHQLPTSVKEKFAEIDAFTELAQQNYITFETYFENDVAFVKATLLSSK